MHGRNAVYLFTLYTLGDGKYNMASQERESPVTRRNCDQSDIISLQNSAHKDNINTFSHLPPVVYLMHGL